VVQIDPDTAVGYLNEIGILPVDAKASSESLGGGISNHVIMVRWEEGCLVVKQPLEKLNVEMDWPADLHRIHIEANALRTYRRLLAISGLEGASAPEVLREDQVNHIIVMECIPSGSQMWKSELLSGVVDLDVAERLGSLLGSVQTLASRDPDVRSMFTFKDHFDELRIDPYHRTAASMNPDIAELVLEEAETVFSGEMTIVHGDYSPKSVLVERSARSPRLWVFDMEVAHWGDPSFDTGFMLNHLLMKAVYLWEIRDDFLEAAHRFWNAYDGSVEWDIEFRTVRELGCLMLARADGKSPVEYLDPGAGVNTIRRIARRSIKEGISTIDGYIQLVMEEGGP